MTTSRVCLSFLLGVFLALVSLTACVQAPTTKPPTRPIPQKVARAIVEGERSFLPPAQDLIPCPPQVREFGKKHPEFIGLLYQKRAGINAVFHCTEDLLKTLDEVNREGNSKITWKGDEHVWGEEERWDFPKEDADQKLYEDCDGFTLWKMRELINRGLPSSPLVFAVVLSLASGEGHAILVVRTDAGDFVLDNNHEKVLTVKEAQLSYVFLNYTVRGSEFDGTWARTYKALHE